MTLQWIIWKLFVCHFGLVSFLFAFFFALFWSNEKFIFGTINQMDDISSFSSVRSLFACTAIGSPFTLVCHCVIDFIWRKRFRSFINSSMAIFVVAHLPDFLNDGDQRRTSEKIEKKTSWKLHWWKCNEFLFWCDRRNTNDVADLMGKN